MNIPQYFNERGGTLLQHSEECWINAWIPLEKDNTWLQISYRDCNYPALDITTTTITKEELAKHIIENFGEDVKDGLWIVKKCNLDIPEFSS